MVKIGKMDIGEGAIITPNWVWKERELLDKWGAADSILGGSPKYKVEWVDSTQGWKVSWTNPTNTYIKLETIPKSDPNLESIELGAYMNPNMESGKIGSIYLQRQSRPDHWEDAEGNWVGGHWECFGVGWMNSQDGTSFSTPEEALGDWVPGEDGDGCWSNVVLPVGENANDEYGAYIFGGKGGNCYPMATRNWVNKVYHA